MSLKHNYRVYPKISDKNFNKKIYNKREFYINKTKKIKTLDKLENTIAKLCKFNLSSNQKFLKTFMSSNTPYNSILLFHGTGVGKTCSSISIAENFKDYLISNNKKINILLNPSIRDNFKKNIFNIEKLKEGYVDDQCTKSRLMKESAIKKTDSYEDISNKINKIINNRYRFYGYIEFSNMVRNLKKFNNDIFILKVKKMFSNTVMIIDEVHNIKDNSGKEGKKLPSYLTEILGIADNMKLILLSATPMFDRADEIIFILNLLLMNDKREPIKGRNLFDKSGKITASGKKIIMEKSRGYISYLRGEHPLKFPKRLYPDIYDDPKLIKTFPVYDINNELIPKDMRIQNLKIIGCGMNTYQLEKYESMDLKTSDDDYGSFNINGLMASNIVYPDVKNTSLIKNIIGDAGLNNIVKKSRNKYSFLEERYKDIFKKKNIGDYSTKIYNILDNIENSKGIVFIYSRFLGSGIIPLALALEMNGYSNYNGSLLENETSKDKKYILITGDNELSKNSYINYLKIENENDKGQKVKVIIGSETAAEGLDFKYIREVHILEPWFHLNKIEQVIGRGIRNCSHIKLPFNKRNVMVYLYASVSPNKYETIDLKMYRISEQKRKNISEVEYLLKTNAIDCGLNKEANRFIDDMYKKKHLIEISKGTNHYISLADEDNSRICNFRECDFRCVPDIDMDNADNRNTLDYRLIEDNIDEIKNFIKTLFGLQFYYQLDDIKKLYIDEYSKDDLDMLYYSLNEMIEQEDKLKDPYNRDSVLKKVGSKYIVKPSYIKKQYASINNLRTPHTKKRKYIDMSAYSNSIKTKKNISTDTSIYQSLIDDLYKKQIKLINDTKKFTKDKKELLISYIDKINKNKFLNLRYSYLEPSKKEILIQIIIKKQKNNMLNKLEKQMIDFLEPYILYNKDVGITSKKDAIFGYKIAENETNVKYMVYKNDAFGLVDRGDKIQILKRIDSNFKKDKSENSTILYLVNKNNRMHIKIKEKNIGKKLTKITSGSICGNEGMKKDNIVEYISAINQSYKMDEEIPRKDVLCLELDIYTRLNEMNKKDNKRWFYMAEEAIEREINQKKI
jgi:hypothetical protein